MSTWQKPMATTNRDAIFVDTSGVFAVLDAGDRFHQPACAGWDEWIQQGEPLLTTNYVVVEATTLIQRRLGMQAVSDLHGAMLPLIRVEWVTRVVHERSLNRFLSEDRRRLSLVDCTSFEVMRLLGLHRTFCCDQHFADRGFACVP